MQRVIVLRRVQSRSTSAHTDFRRRFIDASRTHTLSLRSSGTRRVPTFFFSFYDVSATVLRDWDTLVYDDSLAPISMWLVCDDLRIRKWWNN